MNKTAAKSLCMAALWLLCLFTACTSTKTTISQNANLVKYEYASIINDDTYHIPAELMEYEIKMFDAVEMSGLRLVSDRRIRELAPQQRERLLIVKYGVSFGEEVTTVTVNFIDYMTGRPVVSCKGSCASVGISYGADLEGAIKLVAKEISKTFKN